MFSEYLKNLYYFVEKYSPKTRYLDDAIIFNKLLISGIKNIHSNRATFDPHAHIKNIQFGGINLAQITAGHASLHTALGTLLTNMKNTADCDQLKLDVAQYELITEAISKYIKTLLLIVDDTKLTKFNDQLEEIDQLINKYIGSPQPVVPVTTGSSVVSTTGTGP
jgi:hypothetical protein